MQRHKEHRLSTKGKMTEELNGTHLDLPERAVIMGQWVLKVFILIEDDPAWNLFGQFLCDF